MNRLLGRLTALYRTTAVRLSAVYLLLFAACAAVLVFYVSSMSEGLLRQQMIPVDRVHAEVTIYPGESFLDANGATLAVPLGSGGGRLTADWRFRVAGNAAPASGPALTLSAGF